MSLAEIQTRVKAMVLRGFILRRCTTAFSAFGNVYEFRRLKRSKWYPIHRLNMLFPKLNPDVAAYARQLFDRLNHDEEVEVQGEYMKRGLRANLLIGVQPEESGSQHVKRFEQMSQGKDFARISPAELRPGLVRLHAAEAA